MIHGSMENPIADDYCHLPAERDAAELQLSRGRDAHVYQLGNGGVIPRSGDSCTFTATRTKSDLIVFKATAY